MAYIKPKASFVFLISLAVLALLMSATVVVQSDVEILLKVLMLVPVLVFMKHWKRFCLDTRIQITEGIFSVVTSRIAREPFPVKEMKRIRLWWNKNPSGSQLGKFVGKGQLRLTVELVAGGGADFNVGIFGYRAVRDFLETHIPHEIVSLE